jgi:hypothetical protein
MKFPCAAFVGFLMYLCIASHWGEWHFVVVEWSTEVGACQHIWGGIKLSSEIDGDFWFVVVVDPISLMKSHRMPL